MIKNLNFRILTLIFQIFRDNQQHLVVYCCICSVVWMFNVSVSILFNDGQLILILVPWHDEDVFLLLLTIGVWRWLQYAAVLITSNTMFAWHGSWMWPHVPQLSSAQFDPGRFVSSANIGGGWDQIKRIC